ncbi:hypothetical protein [Paenibacillus harenae]|uniref:hypothetical protein n=1 Tax=Paenibacillus harenae TaxID=306543 RepID=UPI002793D3C9|nr:hypothetical protein [Paenibacillus harenae]MDQ0061878.1 putative RNase H-like HicB family nuclease [Paenibacillus harenae]
MLKSKAIAAGAIALTLTLGGGVLWSSQYVNAATSANTTQTDQNDTEKANDGTTMKKGKGGRLGHGFGKIHEQLQTYLGLDEAALQTQLKTSTLSEIAVAQGKTREELKAKLVEWLKAEEASAPAPTADTDEQSDGQAARTKPDATELAEKLLDAKGGEQGFGKHGRGGMGFGVGLESVAEALGIGSDELKEAMADGKTIAALAAEKGVAVQTVIDAQVIAVKAKLAEKLAAGELTQEQYDAKLAKAAEHAAKLVNGELPDRAQGGGKGPRGERPNEEAAAASGSSETSA